MSIVAETIKFLLSDGHTGHTWQTLCEMREEAMPNSGARTGQTGQDAVHLHPYRFLLRDGEGGGIYMTRAHTLDRATEELQRKYGTGRLALVTAMGASVRSDLNRKRADS